MTTLGSTARPRLLVLGDLPDQCMEALSSRFGTVRKVDGLSQVRVAEWDACLLWRVSAKLAEGVHVVQFADEGTVSTAAGPRGRTYIQHGRESVATEFTVPSDVDPRLHHLVQSELWPLIAEMPRKPVLGHYRANGEFRTECAFPEQFHALLQDGDGKPVAGWFARDGDGREWWCLPGVVADPTSWIDAALARWVEREPEVFRSQHRAYDDPKWQTPDEREAADLLSTLAEKKEEFEAQWRLDLAEATAAAERAAVSAKQGLRRLLTEQGDDLVGAVRGALELLGFAVSDSDASANKGDLLEDLQVTDSRSPGWIALVEVRGYLRGAQSRDLLRIGRFAKRYVQDHGGDPDGLWYVVNQFCESDPSTRSAPLASNPGEVEEFALGGGLIMDTRSLFLATNAALTDPTQLDDIATRMRTATGVLDLNLQHDS